MVGNDVINKFRARFQDASQVTSVKLLNEACLEIFSSVPFLRSNVTLNVTANVYQYALPAAYTKIWSVQYLIDGTSGNWGDLIPTSTDELDDKWPGWRQGFPTIVAQNPLYYYLGNDATLGGCIGFYPTPQHTTAAGFPIVAMDVQSIPTFVDGSESLPDIPFILDAFADLMCVKRAKDVRTSEIEAWVSASQYSFTMLQDAYWKRNPRKPQVQTPAIRQRLDYAGNRKPGARRGFNAFDY